MNQVIEIHVEYDPASLISTYRIKLDERMADNPKFQSAIMTAVAEQTARHIVDRIDPATFTKYLDGGMVADAVARRIVDNIEVKGDVKK